MKPMLVCILAAIFLVSGHFFITAYAGYKTNLEKTTLLKGQERFAKTQIKEFERKKKVLENINNFIDRAEQKGLTKNRWDTFFVNLENESYSFQTLQTILAQTSNNSQYYFEPDSLSIRLGYVKPDDTAQEQEQLPQKQNPPPKPQINLSEKTSEDSDTVITLNGYFLVKKREP